MTTENNTTEPVTTMIDVEVVKSAPDSPPVTKLERELWIATISRVRQANITRIEREALEPKKSSKSKK